MKELFKRLRKRTNSKDPSHPLFPPAFCGKVATLEGALTHRILRKARTINASDETNVNSKEELAQAVPETISENDYKLTRHPLEPTEFDHPIRCPHPEPCIIQDGRAWKERAPTRKTRRQLPFLTASELQRLRWNRRSIPNDTEIYPAASAPEHSLISGLT